MDPAGQYVRLVTTGRKTGRPHGVLVRYVMQERGVVVFPQTGGPQDWVANLDSNPSVLVFSGSSRWEGISERRRISGLHDPVLGAFTRKYGETEVKKRYWGQSSYFLIRLLTQRPEDFVNLQYADLEVAFDGVADTYDHHILDNPMNLWLRERSVNLLTTEFRPGDTVLEVGCGTGTETLRLAKKGIRVVATDVSSRMIEVMMRKARGEGLDDMVIPIHCRPYELKGAVSSAGYPSVDGAYSTYGAVNTEPRLRDMMVNLHGLVRSKGKLVLGVWNKFCILEILGYTLRGRPAMAVARFRNPVPVGRSRFCVATNSFSVASLDRSLRGLFTLNRVIGVEVFLPPSNLTRYLPPRRIMGVLEKVEIAGEALFPINRLGDHFLAVYTKSESPIS